jgi:hypothetical protein
VATGFDASYFAKRQAKTTPSLVAEKSELDVSSPRSSKQEEKALSEIDMELDDDQTDEHHFGNEEEKPIPNIWSIDSEDDDHSDGKDDKASDDHHDIVSSDDLEDELEKPSFLRRLGRKHKESDPDDPSGD